MQCWKKSAKKQTQKWSISYEGFFPSSLQSKPCPVADKKIDFTRQLMPLVLLFFSLFHKQKVLFDQEAGASLSDTHSRESTPAVPCSL